MERVHIGKGLKTLDTDSLGAGELAELTVDPKNSRFKRSGPCLYSADGRELCAFLGEGFFRLPEGAERIGPGAFEGRDGLTEVVFPSTLTGIGPKAFFGSSLRRVEFGGAVRIVIEFGNLEGLNTLAELGVFSGENIDESIELANSTRKPEILSFLMNYKNAETGITETDYEL